MSEYINSRIVEIGSNHDHVLDRIYELAALGFKHSNCVPSVQIFKAIMEFSESDENQTTKLL